MNGPGLTLTVKSIQRCKHYQICETDGEDGRRHYKILSSLPSPYFGSMQELLQYYHTTTILGGLALSDPDATVAARPQSNSFSVAGGPSSDAMSMMSGSLPGEVRCTKSDCDAVIPAPSSTHAATTWVSSPSHRHPVW